MLSTESRMTMMMANNKKKLHDFLKKTDSINYTYFFFSKIYFLVIMLCECTIVHKYSTTRTLTVILLLVYSTLPVHFYVSTISVKEKMLTSVTLVIRYCILQSVSIKCKLATLPYPAIRIHTHHYVILCKFACCDSP